MDGEAILPAVVIRNLGDRSYEKRKTAALEIERLVKEYHTKSDRAKISSLINFLRDEFIESKQANYRKGGLIGLAAVSIGLMKDTSRYLDLMLPPILSLFKDQESRVRYYACESMYNLSKVARENILKYFNNIFDGLCMVCADVDMDVKNGAQLLDRLVKDIVTECDMFDIDGFIPLLQERIRIKNPFIRQLLVGWITILDSVPDIDMLKYLPEYLDGLFNMLSDTEKDIRQQANHALSEFLREIKETPSVDLGQMVPILVDQCKASSTPAIGRVTALQWLDQFISQGRTVLLPHYANILGAILHCIACEKEEAIRNHAERANEGLRELVRNTGQPFDVHALLGQLRAPQDNPRVAARLARLSWTAMLLAKSPEHILSRSSCDSMYSALARALNDADESVVQSALEVFARVAAYEGHFERVMRRVLSVFREDGALLANRGALIIRRLSILLNGEKIYRSMAGILLHETDLEFCSLMVQTLNLILMTSSELFQLRCMIRDCLLEGKKSGQELFIALFNSWGHISVATLSLCLLAQAYELGCSLVFNFADIEVTVGFLMQIDKLVQLIDSPIFMHLRLQLLEPQRHPFLLKILYGILMLLPQSSSYEKLSSRLRSASQLGSISCIPDSKFAKSKDPIRVSETKQLDFRKLLDQFNSIQSSHTMKRKDELCSKSLMNSSQDPLSI
eukprot:976219_1